MTKITKLLASFSLMLALAAIICLLLGFYTFPTFNALKPRKQKTVGFNLSGWTRTFNRYVLHTHKPKGRDDDPRSKESNNKN